MKLKTYKTNVKGEIFMKKNRRIKNLVAMLLLCVLFTCNAVTAMAASQLERPTSLKVDLEDWEFRWSKVRGADGYTVRLYERISGEKDPGPDEYLVSKFAKANYISMDCFNDIFESDSRDEKAHRYFFRVYAMSDECTSEDSEISGCSGTFTYTENCDDEVYDDEEEELNGWEKIGRYYYYYRNGKLLKDRWLKVDDCWYVLGKSGERMESQWYEDDDGKTYYLGYDGKMQISKWIYNVYYVGADGVRYQDMEAKVGNKWYSFDSKGRATLISEPQSNQDNNTSKFAGFKRGNDGYWYYYENGSIVKDDWREVLGSDQKTHWYCFNANGRMRADTWYQYKGEWYYLGKYGVMATSTWIENKYYVGADGVMYHDCQKKIGQTLYNFDSNGVATEVYNSSIYTSAGNTPGYWLQINGTWAFFYNDGRQATPGTWITWNGRWAYIDADYRAAQNRYADIKGTRYWFDKNCYMYDSKPIK